MAYNAGHPCDLPAATQNVQPHLIMAQRPSTELLIQMGEAHQKEILAHDATKQMLYLYIQRSAEAEQQLWDYRVQSAADSCALEWYRKHLDERNSNDPNFVEMQNSLKAEQRSATELRTQVNCLQQELANMRQQKVGNQGPPLP